LSAQTYRLFQDELNDIVTRVRWRIGPLRIRPELQLRSIGYDDNVYYQPETGEQVSDYTALISPEIKTYLIVGHSLIVSLNENPEYLYFRKEKGLRTFTNSYSPGFRLLLFNRFVLSADYHRQKHRRRALTEFERQVTDMVEGFNLGLFMETPRGTSFGISASSDRYRFENVILPDYTMYYSRILDRTENTGNFELYYRVFSDSTFFVKTGYTKYQFEYPEARWRDSLSYQVFTGMRLPLMGRATGVLSLGYKKFIPAEKGLRGFSGFIADTSLDYRSGRMGFRLGYKRDTRFSYWESAFFYIENLVGTGVSLYITRRLKLDYGFQISRLDYPQPFPVDTPDLGLQYFDRKDTFRTHSLGIVIRILRTTGLGISYNISERNSSIPGFDLRRSFIGAYLTQGF
jgi:hypothetical protein